MKLITDWDKCELFPETKEERELIFALYDKLNKDNPTDVKLLGSEDAIYLYIHTYE